MAQGCIGIDPSPIACCPQSDYTYITDPDPAVECDINGWEAGSEIYNTVDGTLWRCVIATCPATWVCIAGCDTDLYHLRVDIDDTAAVQSFAGAPTPIAFTDLQYEYPSGVSAWSSPTFTAPNTGIYIYSINIVLNLRNKTINQTSDFLITVIRNGATTEAKPSGVSVFSSVNNEFLYLDASQQCHLTATDTLTFNIEHDAGVSIDTLNAASNPSFPRPAPGFLTISQLA